MCRIASFFLLQRLKGSMSGDAHDFNNIGSQAVIKFFFLQSKAPKEIHAFLTETFCIHIWIQHKKYCYVHLLKFVGQKNLNFVDQIFWDQDGILLIDYLPKGQTINAEYYLSLLVQLKDILKEKHRGKVIKEVLFLHDNAPAHRTLATQKKLAYLGFQCLSIKDVPHTISL